jgi:arsenate reductase
MPRRLYIHPRCTTCKKAVSYLLKLGISLPTLDITKTPPTESDIKAVLKVTGGSVKKLFNTTGQLYRELDLASQLPKMQEDEAIKLLAKHGMLVKRPLMVSDDGEGLVGFTEKHWEDIFKKEQV